jgi:hypothetical protein
MGKKQALLWRVQIVLFAVAYIPSAVIMVYNMFIVH